MELYFHYLWRKVGYTGFTQLRKTITKGNYASRDKNSITIQTQLARVWLLFAF